MTTGAAFDTEVAAIVRRARFLAAEFGLEGGAALQRALEERDGEAEGADDLQTIERLGTLVSVRFPHLAVPVRALLRRIRKKPERGKTQKRIAGWTPTDVLDVGAAVGTSRETVYRWLRGQKVKPETAAAIEVTAAKLGLPPRPDQGGG